MQVLAGPYPFLNRAGQVCWEQGGPQLQFGFVISDTLTPNVSFPLSKAGGWFSGDKNLEWLQAKYQSVIHRLSAGCELRSTSLSSSWLCPGDQGRPWQWLVGLRSVSSAHHPCHAESGQWLDSHTFTPTHPDLKVTAPPFKDVFM